jgi:hypothetical protein
VNKDIQKEFLYSLLGFFDSRREAIDLRSSVILAASSLGLGLFLSQMKHGEFLYPDCSLVYKILAILILSSFLLACGMSLSLIAPISRSHKIKKIKAKSLSWFYLIAEETHEEYHKDITELSDDDILKELTKQVLEISKLLKKRYDRLEYSCKCLYIGIAILLIYIVLMMFK